MYFKKKHFYLFLLMMFFDFYDIIEGKVIIIIVFISGETMLLSKLPKGQEAKIHYVSHPCNSMQIQLSVLGFDPGETVKLLMKAPLGNPLQVKVGETLVAINTDDAQHIHLYEVNRNGHNK